MNVSAITGHLRRGYARACLAAGPVFIALAIGFGIHTSSFLHHSIAADGTIVSLRTVKDDKDGTTTYAPIFTFLAANGQTYTVSSDSGSNPPSFAPGKHVRVLYEAGNPIGAEIDSFWQVWVFPVVFAIIGLIATVMGHALYRYEKPKSPQFSLIPGRSTQPHSPAS
jgi:hypothetical protein